MLKVNSLVFNLSEDNKTFLYGISKTINDLSIEAITESDTATVEITGNEKLEPGINTINIKVTQVLKEGVPATETTEAIEPEIEEILFLDRWCALDTLVKQKLIA
jgi:hypothetical protein